MRESKYLAAVALVALCGCQQLRFWDKGRDTPITPASETIQPSPAAQEPVPPEPSSGPRQEPAAPVPLDQLPQRQPDATATGQATGAFSTEVATGVTVRVNDRVLTADDILRAAALELAKVPPGLLESAFRLRAEKIITDELRRQISQWMAMREAERVLTDEQKRLIDQEMEATLAAMVSQAGGTRRKLEADLISQGTTLEEVLANQRRELTVRWFLRWKFAPAVSVTRAMLWDYYCRHKSDFAAPKKVQMQIIFVPLAAFLASPQAQPSGAERAAARTAARARIDQAAEAIRGGEDFAAVARRFSTGPKAEDGGLWPLMPAGSFRQEQVEQVAFSQGAGEVSDVLELEEGFCIVKTAAVQETSTISFEDAQVEIEKILRDQQAAQLYNDYYAKLLAETTIVQSENFIPTAVDRALERYLAR